MADKNNEQWFQKPDNRNQVKKQDKKKPVNSKRVATNEHKQQVQHEKKQGTAAPVSTKGVKPTPKKKPVNETNVNSKNINKKNPKKVAKVTDIETKKQPSQVNDVSKKKNQKRVKLKGIKYALLALIILLVAGGVYVFSVHHLLDYFAVKPEMAFIENGSIEHTIGARALIVRDETIISTNATGDLVTQATEGSRVYAGQHIALVVPDDMQSVVSNLRNTQSQISEVQQELIAGGSAPGADAIYEDINSGLVPIVDMIRLDAMDGNVSDMASYMSSISVLLNQRESELSALQFDDERLRVLREDEAGYERQLQNNSASISTSKPGIISFKLDGLESELSFDTLLDAEPSTIRDYINSSTGLITSDLYIEENENVARIASNEEQYIAVYLKSKDASAAAFQVGTLHTINVSSEGVSIGKCLVERCVSMDDGTLIIFSTTHYVEDLLDLRTVDIEIVITETSGLRVPVSSLVNPDYERGIASIYINNKGFADEVGVIIEDYDREFVIISPIGDNSVPNTQTVIIINPDSIKPGEMVDK